MSRTLEITLTIPDAEHLIEATQDRIDFLGETAASLMKKKLPDAAKPLYESVKRLTSTKGELEEKLAAIKQPA